jgi:hypothetical protein
VVRGYRPPRTKPPITQRAKTAAVSKARAAPGKAYQSAKTNFPKVSEFKAPRGYQHVLMGEMVVSFLIIGLRAVADYIPNEDTHYPGKEAPKKGQSPIVLIASTLVVYFVLSFLATRGEWQARTASAFGTLMILGLLVNSQDELSQVAGWVENMKGNSAHQPNPPSDNGSSTGGGNTNLPPGQGPPVIQNPHNPIS